MAKDLISQNKVILDYLKEGHGLTALEALKLCGTLRLSGRIWELRSQGHNITTKMVVRNGKRIAQDHLEQE